MPDFDDVVALCATFPDVTEELSYRTPALKVRGRAFCRLWGERDFRKADVPDSDVLVVFCRPEDKAGLLAHSDGSVFTAPHYDGHPAVLVRLRTVRRAQLAALLAESYAVKSAPARAPRPTTARRRSR